MLNVVADGPGYLHLQSDVHARRIRHQVAGLCHDNSEPPAVSTDSGGLPRGPAKHGDSDACERPRLQVFLRPADEARIRVEALAHETEKVIERLYAMAGKRNGNLAATLLALSCTGLLVNERSISASFSDATQNAKARGIYLQAAFKRGQEGNRMGNSPSFLGTRFSMKENMSEKEIAVEEMIWQIIYDHVSEVNLQCQSVLREIIAKPGLHEYLKHAISRSLLGDRPDHEGQSTSEVIDMMVCGELHRRICDKSVSSVSVETMNAIVACKMSQQSILQMPEMPEVTALTDETLETKMVFEVAEFPKYLAEACKVCWTFVRTRFELERSAAVMPKSDFGDPTEYILESLISAEDVLQSLCSWVANVSMDDAKLFKMSDDIVESHQKLGVEELRLRKELGSKAPLRAFNKHMRKKTFANNIDAVRGIGKLLSDRCASPELVFQQARKSFQVRKMGLRWISNVSSLPQYRVAKILSNYEDAEKDDDSVEDRKCHVEAESLLRCHSALLRNLGDNLATLQRDRKRAQKDLTMKLKCRVRRMAAEEMSAKRNEFKTWKDAMVLRCAKLQGYITTTVQQLENQRAALKTGLRKWQDLENLTDLLHQKKMARTLLDQKERSVEDVREQISRVRGFIENAIEACRHMGAKNIKFNAETLELFGCETDHSRRHAAIGNLTGETINCDQLQRSYLGQAAHVSVLMAQHLKSRGDPVPYFQARIRKACRDKIVASKNPRGALGNVFDVVTTMSTANAGDWLQETWQEAWQSLCTGFGPQCFQFLTAAHLQNPLLSNMYVEPSSVEAKQVKPLPLYFDGFHHVENHLEQVLNSSSIIRDYWSKADFFTSTDEKGVYDTAYSKYLPPRWKKPMRCATETLVEWASKVSRLARAFSQLLGVFVGNRPDLLDDAYQLHKWAHIAPMDNSGKELFTVSHDLALKYVGALVVGETNRLTVLLNGMRTCACLHESALAGSAHLAARFEREGQKHGGDEEMSELDLLLLETSTIKAIIALKRLEPKVRNNIAKLSANTNYVPKIVTMLKSWKQRSQHEREVVLQSALNQISKKDPLFEAAHERAAKTNEQYRIRSEIMCQAPAMLADIESRNVSRMLVGCSEALDEILDFWHHEVEFLTLRNGHDFRQWRIRGQTLFQMPKMDGPNGAYDSTSETTLISKVQTEPNLPTAAEFDDWAAVLASESKFVQGRLSPSMQLPLLWCLGSKFIFGASELCIVQELATKGMRALPWFGFRAANDFGLQRRFALTPVDEAASHEVFVPEFDEVEKKPSINIIAAVGGISHCDVARELSFLQENVRQLTLMEDTHPNVLLHHSEDSVDSQLGRQQYCQKLHETVIKSKELQLLIGDGKEDEGKELTPNPLIAAVLELVAQVRAREQCWRGLLPKLEVEASSLATSDMASETGIEKGSDGGGNGDARSELLQENDEERSESPGELPVPMQSSEQVSRGTVLVTRFQDAVSDNEENTETRSQVADLQPTTPRKQHFRPQNKRLTGVDAMKKIRKTAFALSTKPEKHRDTSFLAPGRSTIGSSRPASAEIVINGQQHKAVSDPILEKERSEIEKERSEIENRIRFFEDSISSATLRRKDLEEVVATEATNRDVLDLLKEAERENVKELREFLKLEYKKKQCLDGQVKLVQTLRSMSRPKVRTPIANPKISPETVQVACQILLRQPSIVVAAGEVATGTSSVSISPLPDADAAGGAGEYAKNMVSGTRSMEYSMSKASGDAAPQVSRAMPQQSAELGRLGGEFSSTSISVGWTQKLSEVSSPRGENADLTGRKAFLSNRNSVQQEKALGFPTMPMGAESADVDSRIEFPQRGALSPGQSMIGFRPGSNNSAYELAGRGTLLQNPSSADGSHRSAHGTAQPDGRPLQGGMSQPYSVKAVRFNGEGGIQKEVKTAGMAVDEAAQMDPNQFGEDVANLEFGTPNSDEITGADALKQTQQELVRHKAELDNMANTLVELKSSGVVAGTSGGRGEDKMAPQKMDEILRVVSESTQAVAEFVGKAELSADVLLKAVSPSVSPRGPRTPQSAGGLGPNYSSMAVDAMNFEVLKTHLAQNIMSMSAESFRCQGAEKSKGETSSQNFRPGSVINATRRFEPESSEKNIKSHHLEKEDESTEQFFQSLSNRITLKDKATQPKKHRASVLARCFDDVYDGLPLTLGLGSADSNEEAENSPHFPSIPPPAEEPSSQARRFVPRFAHAQPVVSARRETQPSPRPQASDQQWFLKQAEQQCEIRERALKFTAEALSKNEGGLQGLFSARARMSKPNVSFKDAQNSGNTAEIDDVEKAPTLKTLCEKETNAEINDVKEASDLKTLLDKAINVAQEKIFELRGEIQNQEESLEEARVAKQELKTFFNREKLIEEREKTKQIAKEQHRLLAQKRRGLQAAQKEGVGRDLFHSIGAGNKRTILSAQVGFHQKHYRRQGAVRKIPLEENDAEDERIDHVASPEKLETHETQQGLKQFREFVRSRTEHITEKEKESQLRRATEIQGLLPTAPASINHKNLGAPSRLRLSVLPPGWLECTQEESGSECSQHESQCSSITACVPSFLGDFEINSPIVATETTGALCFDGDAEDETVQGHVMHSVHETCVCLVYGGNSDRIICAIPASAENRFLPAEMQGVFLARRAMIRPFVHADQRQCPSEYNQQDSRVPVVILEASKTLLASAPFADPNDNSNIRFVDSIGNYVLPDAADLQLEAWNLHEDDYVLPDSDTLGENCDKWKFPAASWNPIILNDVFSSVLRGRTLSLCGQAKHNEKSVECSLAARLGHPGAAKFADGVANSLAYSLAAKPASPQNPPQRKVQVVSDFTSATSPLRRRTLITAAPAPPHEALIEEPTSPIPIPRNPPPPVCPLSPQHSATKRLPASGCTGKFPKIPKLNCMLPSLDLETQASPRTESTSQPRLDAVTTTLGQDLDVDIVWDECLRQMGKTQTTPRSKILILDPCSPISSYTLPDFDSVGGWDARTTISPNSAKMGLNPLSPPLSPKRQLLRGPRLQCQPAPIPHSGIKGCASPVHRRFGGSEVPNVRNSLPSLI